MTSVAESHRKTSVDKGVLREGQCQRDVHNRPFSVLTGTFPANTTFVELYFFFFFFSCQAPLLFQEDGEESDSDIFDVVSDIRLLGRVIEPEMPRSQD